MFEVREQSRGSYVGHEQIVEGHDRFAGRYLPPRQSVRQPASGQIGLNGDVLVVSEACEDAPLSALPRV